jgi:hypothetical protein
MPPEVKEALKNFIDKYVFVLLLIFLCMLIMYLSNKMFGDNNMIDKEVEQIIKIGAGVP